MKLQMLKRALIAYVSNSVKAIWSAVAHPLTIVGSKSGNVKDYKIYGNSVQNGEHTPDNPVGVQSVGELVTEGENVGKYKIPITIRGKNLFNINAEREILKGRLPTDSYKVENGVMSFKTGYFVISSTAFGIKVQVKKNTDYWLNYTLLAGRPVIRGYSQEGVQVLSTNTPYRSFNSGDNEVLYFGFTSNSWDMYTELTDIIIVENSNPDKTFEPYIEPQTIDISLDEPLGAGEVVQKSVDGLPNLPQFKGTTVYEAKTEIPPSGIQVQYY
jgi:hypothetical protein